MRDIISNTKPVLKIVGSEFHVGSLMRHFEKVKSKVMRIYAQNGDRPDKIRDQAMTCFWSGECKKKSEFFNNLNHFNIKYKLFHII